METNRLEAFSDGVLAIIITIMVWEMKVPRPPQPPDWTALQPLVPVLLSYVLSFIYVGIYWNNHHHLIKACRHVTGPIMWANLHLLFWLSLFPFSSGWMGENKMAPLPTAFYGAILLMAALAYKILQTLIIADMGENSKLGVAIGSDYKGWLSTVLYAVAMGVAFYHPWVASSLYVVVALMWLIPDRRIEEVVEE